MKQYILTSSKIPNGQVTFGYNADGLLVVFSIEGALSITQVEYLHKHLPLTTQAMALLQKKESDSGTMRIVEAVQEVTFAEFWNEYDNKVDKSEAEKIWNKLDAASQYEAYQYIKTYKTRKTKEGTAVAYPKTYLRQKPWIQ